MTVARRRRPTAALLAAAAVLVLVGCTATTPTTTSTGTTAAGSAGAAAAPATSPTELSATVPPARRQPPPPYRVVTTTETFVDTSRPTEAGAATPAAPDRTLVTTLRVPDAPGPRPLVVFSHGLSGHPDKLSGLLEAWATAGYVVAAPAFPLTNDHVPGSPGNWTGLAQQPADVSFVIDRLLAGNDDPSSAWYGRIDPGRIGVGGHSLGGATTYALTFNPCCRDDRVTAAMILSGALLPPGGGEPDLDGHVPLLIVHGDEDGSLPIAMAIDAYGRANGPVWFVTLPGGSHSAPYENDPSPQDEVVPALTTAWWDAELGGDPGALARFDTEADRPGLTSVIHK